MLPDLFKVEYYLLFLLSINSTASGWLAGVFLKHQAIARYGVREFVKDSLCNDSKRD